MFGHSPSVTDKDQAWQVAVSQLLTDLNTVVALCVKSPVKTVPSDSRLVRWWRKEIRPIAIFALVIFSIRSSLADWNDVPTGSMKPTILEGDRVFVNKLAYDLKAPFTTWHLAEWSAPQRGDIVVFFSPYDGKRLVKRVVGLPGDILELRNDRLILNGKTVEYQPLDEQRLHYLAANDRANHLFAVED